MAYLEGAKSMPRPEMTVIGEGHLQSGEHWILRAGGTEDDYYTYLETVHPDGHRDAGEQIEVPSVGNDPAMGLTFYATLLPRSARPTLVKAFDGEGRVIAQSPLR